MGTLVTTATTLDCVLSIAKRLAPEVNEASQSEGNSTGKNPRLRSETKNSAYRHRHQENLKRVTTEKGIRTRRT
jgi:hypothetical protein